MEKFNLAGMTFGRWTVLRRNDRKKIVEYVCRCECGVERDVLGVSLRKGRSVSCGCAQVEGFAAHRKVALHRVHRSTYNTWSGMKQRCLYEGHSEWHRYGGRGITLDPRWHSFEEFLEDMGPKPEGMSLERQDNDGPYTKGNCRWATRDEQNANKSTNLKVEIEGKMLTLKQVADAYNASYTVLHKWYRYRGATIQEAIAKATARPRSAIPRGIDQ